MRALVLSLLLQLVPASVAGASTVASRHAKASLVSCDATGDTAAEAADIAALQRLVAD